MGTTKRNPSRAGAPTPAREPGAPVVRAVGWLAPALLILMVLLIVVTFVAGGCFVYRTPSASTSPEGEAPGPAVDTSGSPSGLRVNRTPRTPSGAGEDAPRPLQGPYTDLRRHTFRAIGEDNGIDVSPDGESLLFSSTRDSETPKIFLKEADSPLVRSITTGGFRDLHPKFSPDGKWIAFASDREGNFDIWLVSAERPASLEQITSTPEDEVHPSFSPDGEQITFCRHSRRQGWNLWIKHRRQQRLIELGPGLFPEWSPTGEWIAFQKPRQRGKRWYSLWVIRPDGSDVRQLVAFDDRGAVGPAWSPRGDQIAFTTTHREATMDRARVLASHGDEVAIVELRRGRVFQLTHHRNGAGWSPAWGLNGRIYFTSDRYGGRNILSLVPPEVSEL